MKKFFKILGVLILLVALIIGGFAAFISIRGIPKFEANVPQIPKIEVTPVRVEKGKKIYNDTSGLNKVCRISRVVNIHYINEKEKKLHRCCATAAISINPPENLPVVK